MKVYYLALGLTVHSAREGLKRSAELQTMITARVVLLISDWGFKVLCDSLLRSYSAWEQLKMTVGSKE